MIYKICRPEEWAAAQATQCFDGAPVDLADGFIHFSTAAQVRKTAARHFSDERQLIVLTVDAAILGDAIRWEPSRGGDLFPHLYGTLPLDVVQAVHPVALGVDGVHLFPAEISG